MAVRLGLAISLLVPLSIALVLVGSQLGEIETRYQPMKIAAAEAQWETCQPCSFSAFQIGGGSNDENPTEVIAIPHLLSVLATLSWDGKVVGLNELQASYEQQYGPGTTSRTCSCSTGRCGSWRTSPPASCCSHS